MKRNLPGRLSVFSAAMCGSTLCISSVALAQDITRVSVDSAGQQVSLGGTTPTISDDANVVAFTSLAPDLVSTDGNKFQDVFVHDRTTGVTEICSVDNSGNPGNTDSSLTWPPVLNSDGQFVAFTSGANNLVPLDKNRRWDIFVRDRKAGTTERVSVDSSGLESNGDSLYPGISADGRWVVFQSYATNLVKGDTNGVPDVFIHDRQHGLTTRS